MRSINDKSDEGCITVSAPGKVLVAGGYLVLDRPNVGVVLAATARFYTSVKWTDEQASIPPAGTVEESRAFPQRLRMKVESPQFRMIYWYDCIFYEDGRLPTLLSSPDQASNIFVERTLTYVLGYLLEAGRAGAEKIVETGASLMEYLALAGEGARVLAIKLRADNDFYSQTSQLSVRGLPCTAEALATLPPFLECPINDDGAVVVAKTGMGSSAALISSLVGALLSFFGKARFPCDSSSSDAALNVDEGSDGPDSRVNESLDLTHNLAQACHCVAQGKVGSGFDVSAAVYGTHIYTRFSPSEIADTLSAGDKSAARYSAPSSSVDGHANGCDPASAIPTPLQRISKCVEAQGGWDAERGQLRLPFCFRLLMGDVCGGSSTPSMVKKVQAWRADPSTATLAKEIWSALGSTNSTIAGLLNSVTTTSLASRKHPTGGDSSFEAVTKHLSALPSDKWAEFMQEDRDLRMQSVEQLIQLKAAFAKARRLLRDMGEHAGVPIEPPVQTKLVDATCALPGVLCAGVPGAGGVDAVFAITVHPESESGVRELWASWRFGGEDIVQADNMDADRQGEDVGGGFVCPLLLSASESGLEGGTLYTRKLSWE